MRFSRSYCDAEAHNNGLGAIMQRNKIILLAAVCGAVAGALATGFGGNAPANVPVFALDNALKGHWPTYIACAFGWVLFSAYWEVAAKGAAKAKSSGRGDPGRCRRRRL
jgi:hypothetical protein